MISAIMTLFSALALACVSGWFSIAGIISIYAGAPFHAAMVMGVVLHLAQITTLSWLYRNWEYASWKIKIPLMYFTTALMIATSIGVFGFLTQAHLQQGASTIDNSAKIERIDQQISREQSVIHDDEKIIIQLDSTVQSFMEKDRTDRALAVRRSQAGQRKQLRNDIVKSQERIDSYNEEKLKLTSAVRALQLEVGPIRYIAELFNDDGIGETEKIESAVKLFTLLIVSTLDPLAVVLLIAANHTLLRPRDEKKKSKNVEIQEALPIQEYPVHVSDVKEIESPPESDREPPNCDSAEVTHEVLPLTQVDEEIQTPHDVYQMDIGDVTWPDIPKLPSKELAPREAVKPVPDESPEKWDNQSAVIRELMGRPPHFVPQKVIEPKVKSDAKYPRALSWLTEFKGD